MELICKVDSGAKHHGFSNFKAIIEVAPGKLFETTVESIVWNETGHITINSGPMKFDPRSLKFSCSSCHAAEMLLHVEICKAVSEFYPELSHLVYEKQHNCFISNAEGKI